MKYFFLVICFFAIFPLSAQIHGLVWHDVNGDAICQSAEVGISGVRVKVFDLKGNLLRSDVTDKLGKYYFSTDDQKLFRIQFSELPEGYFPTQGQSLVRFVTSSTASVSLGIYDPKQFVSSKANVFVARQLNGNYKDSTDAPVLIRTSAFGKGETTFLPGNASLLGSVWALAYDRSKNRLFSAAFGRRFSAYGKLGTGGIYVTDLNTQTTRPFLNLSDLGIATGPDAHRSLTGSRRDYKRHHVDSVLFHQVGKVSLGGMDLSEDGKTLFVVNVYEKSLLALDLSGGDTPAGFRRYRIPGVTDKSGSVRPWAVKCKDGQVYVGVVTDAQHSQKTADLKAIVYVLDASKSTFREIFSMSLDYGKAASGRFYPVKGWRPWTDDAAKLVVPGYQNTWAYPQPILADLEFDTDGSMILGLMDRTGLQGGMGHYSTAGKGSGLFSTKTSGDILRIAKVKNHFELEANGKAGERISKGGVGNAQGPGGGEFYFRDNFVPEGAENFSETIAGGIALNPATNSLLAVVHIPIDRYNVKNAGIRWMSNQDGELQEAVELETEEAFWVSSQLGDLEIEKIDPATALSGRVWLDGNGNGLQDADEASLTDIPVELWKNDQRIAVTQTDATGRYVFSSDAVLPETAYEIRFDYDGKVTGCMQGEDRGIDSDLLQRDGKNLIALKTGRAGENQSDLDAGFVCNTSLLTNVRLECSGQGSSRTLTLVADGFGSGERFSLVKGTVIDKPVRYEDASAIPSSGKILTTVVSAWVPEEYTVRLLNREGCWKDVYFSSSSSVGCGGTSFLLSSENSAPEEEMSIGPNPTTRMLHVKARVSGSGEASVEVADLSGKILLTRPVSIKASRIETTLDVQQLPAGEYVIRIRGEVASKPFIKQ